MIQFSTTDVKEVIDGQQFRIVEVNINGSDPFFDLEEPKVLPNKKLREIITALYGEYNPEIDYKPFMRFRDWDPDLDERYEDWLLYIKDINQ